MTRYQVDSEAVLSATGAVQNSISRIQAEVAGLHGQLTNLQGSWTGQAATAFSAVVTDWKATQQRVEENLAAINTALSQAGQQYAEIEAANARLFSR
ncbi:MULTISPECIES: WXG100 family type VII secretion target [unclassified Salinibacterium]|uniref:WXG100 family type VII secretion target n=1 Tax=unclassified Salinibacterium TaxID=2632331 RepID=UPI0018CCE056|nr:MULTISPECIES: WXG100 family type VII secretion target [unclassified Salinibacterium]MBH0053499.1 WXG100 family type VII secretion target [Salinibacterium sp. SWN139]MBH0082767.1 WXG100 family type VII secretion target [Salinibacterium sp. SWN167]MBH0116210.1 WXG100 family type VII secretion target [Salinibacterium sp. NG253]